MPEYYRFENRVRKKPHTAATNLHRCQTLIAATCQIRTSCRSCRIDCLESAGMLLFGNALRPPGNMSQSTNKQPDFTLKGLIVWSTLVNSPAQAKNSVGNFGQTENQVATSVDTELPQFLWALGYGCVRQGVCLVKRVLRICLRWSQSSVTRMVRE